MEWTAADGIRALERMYERASCRNFDDKKIPEDLLRNIIDAGLCAASGGNLQPVSVIMITKDEARTELCKVCGNQKFIEQAPVNLLFLLDWHKMSIFAKNQNAPFTCHDSFMHFLIGLEDVICAAQSMETAAHLLGLGSCYVGTTNTCADELIKLYNLPQYTYPVVLLSLGYPKTELPKRKKLGYDIMVFNDEYPELTEDFIYEKYYQKYGDAAMSLPPGEPYRTETLERLKKAFLTSYSAEKTDELIKAAAESGKINETQRRFGLHYHAKGMREAGVDVIKMFADQALTPFHGYRNEPSIRELRRKDLELPAEKAAELLQNGIYGTLSLVSEANSAYGVQLSYCVIDDNIYFHCAHEGQKIEYIKHNPSSCFSVTGSMEIIEAGYTMRYESVIAFGDTCIVEDMDEKRKALTALSQKYSPSMAAEIPAKVDGALHRTCVLRLKIKRLTGKGGL